jgi:hypothetical protein
LISIHEEFGEQNAERNSNHSCEIGDIDVEMEKSKQDFPSELVLTPLNGRSSYLYLSAFHIKQQVDNDLEDELMGNESFSEASSIYEDELFNSSDEEDVLVDLLEFLDNKKDAEAAEHFFETAAMKRPIYEGHCSSYLGVLLAFFTFTHLYGKNSPNFAKKITCFAAVVFASGTSISKFYWKYEEGNFFLCSCVKTTKSEKIFTSTC